MSNIFHDIVHVAEHEAISFVEHKAEIFALHEVEKVGAGLVAALL